MVSRTIQAQAIALLVLTTMLLTGGLVATIIKNQLVPNGAAGYSCFYDPRI
jgi:hypothetical protein